MGLQQSYVKFENEKLLLEELKKYVKRDSKGDQTYVLGTVKVLKSMEPFLKGELAIVLGGERHGQRNLMNLKEETGIENAQSITFIDNETYCMLSGGDLGKFLNEHFYFHNPKEFNELVMEE